MAVEKSSRISSDRPSPSINAKHAVFVDADAMKERVKQSIMKPEYDVKNYYFQEGHFQFIARHCIFEYLTLAVIAANAVWIAIDTDHNGEDSLLDAQTVFVVGENFFCVYFSLELLIRFMAFEEKKNCLRDAGFVFDSILVVMMVMETWVMTAILLLTQTGGSSGLGNTSILRLVRLLRLSRMARMARLLRAMPELMILVKGIVAATRSVFFTLCLLVILIYVFGIAFVQLTADMDSNVHDDYFKKVPRAMHSLLLHLVLPDEAALILEVGEDSWGLAALLLIFVLLSTLTILNMLVGVLVEVVSVVSEVEKEQMMVSFVKTELLSLLNDVDGNMKISKTEFEQLLLDPKAAKIIQEVGVDVVGLVDFTDHIFAGDTELTFPEFMDLILQLRGSNGATVRDMVDMRKFLSNNLIDAVERIEKVVRQTDIVMRRATLPSCKSWEYEVQTSEGIASVGIARGPSLRLVESVAHPLTEDACLSEQDEKAVDGVKEVREG
jgi:voltage-gated sodium channel